MLVKLQFKPGVSADGSRYSGAGQWCDCDKVRFRQGAPEKIGGWQRTSPTAAAFSGTARSMIAWTNLVGDAFLGFGTNIAYYIESGSANYDITPYRTVATLVDPFSMTNTLTEVTVTDVAHGAAVGDTVTFSGATAAGGLTLNGTFTIVTAPTVDTYTITAGSAATSTVVGGGAAVVASYDLNPGIDSSAYGTGWGAGPWGGFVLSGSTGWGSGAAVTAESTRLRLWSNDTFGQDLILNPRDGAVYYWAAAGGLGTRAVAVADMAGAASVPAVVRQILVSDQDRRVFGFGCSDILTGVQDPLLIRWTDAENPVDWAPTDVNTSGDLRIPSGAEFIAARETKQEILVWADDSLHSLRYVGSPFYYGISRVGATSIAGPNAVAVANDLVFWMGSNGFYRYDGRIVPLPCTVRDYVFNNMNLLQADKICAGSNMSFNEVWWLEPSADAAENDRYVVYNYLEDVWTYGALARTAWLDRVVEDYPRAAGDDGFLYYHEIGNDAGSTAMPAFIESGPVEIGQGDDFGFAWRMIPDVGFRNSTGSPLVMMTLEAQDAAGDSFTQTEANAVIRATTVPVETFTKFCWFRLRGRALTLRVASSDAGVAWRLGVPRIDVRVDGKRG